MLNFKFSIFVSALLSLLPGAFTAHAADTDAPASKPEPIAPNVWRIHFGNPEQFTPTHFRTAEPDLTGLKKLPDSPTKPPLDISFRVSNRGCSVLIPMQSAENIYGLGLNAKLFDLAEGKTGPSGRRIFLEPTDMPENDLGESHAPVPFFVSSRGYGVFVDTARFASVYTGDDDPLSNPTETEAGGDNGVQTSTADLYRARNRHTKNLLVDVPVAQGVDVYVFAGPTMLDAVQRYNLFSGGGALPPLWGLGVQYRGYAKYGAQESLALAQKIRDDHMPCDVWGVEPGWQTKTYSSSFVWNTNQFPDPDAFIQKMHDMGYRMNFWEHAFTHPSSPMYNDLQPWAGDYRVWGGLVPDFASPQGRAVFLKQNHASLFDRGVEGVKLDECDYQPDSAYPWSFPPNSVFPSGLDGEQMHSLFGLLYQQTMLTPYQEKGVRTWGLVRNSHALAAPLPYALYSDSYDPHCYVRAVCNEGFSGLLWTPEVRSADSIEDFYRRIETVIFSADAVINSWFIKNPPWDQVNRNKNNNDELDPDRATTVAAVRQLLEIRMRFLPYLYSAFNAYHTAGTPPIRALVLDWPRDPKVREIDDEYMFGPSVLVAPMFAKEGPRKVYLPAGDWYDFWTHAKIEGGTTIDATNGVDQIPLFVKGGTLLPLAEPVEYVKPDTCFNITVNIVGEKPADFTLFEDDGLTAAYSKGEQNEIALHANGDDHSANRTGNYHGAERYKITDWKKF